METESRFGFEVYPKRHLTIVRGEGATLWDEQGRAYIDCTAGVGVANVGHCNPGSVRCRRPTVPTAYHLSWHFLQRRAGSSHGIPGQGRPGHAFPSVSFQLRDGSHGSRHQVRPFDHWSAYYC